MSCSEGCHESSQSYFRLVEVVLVVVVMLADLEVSFDGDIGDGDIVWEPSSCLFVLAVVVAATAESADASAVFFCNSISVDGGGGTNSLMSASSQ